MLVRAAVPEFDPRAAAAAKAQAALLAAAEEHLGKLLAELQAAMPSLAACGFKILKAGLYLMMTPADVKADVESVKQFYQMEES